MYHHDYTTHNIIHSRIDHSMRSVPAAMLTAGGQEGIRHGAEANPTLSLVEELDT